MNKDKLSRIVVAILVIVSIVGGSVWSLLTKDVMYLLLGCTITIFLIAGRIVYDELIVNE